MPSWDFSCPDWEGKLKRGETPIPALPLDELEAEAAVAYFNKLRLPDVAGQPTMADAAGEWARDLVRAAFGSAEFRRLDDGTREIIARHVGELFVLVPKKNSKTTNSAALGLVALLMNEIQNVDGIIVAPTQSVAETCYAQACGMIRADDYLNRAFKIREHRHEIVDIRPHPENGRPMNVTLKVKSFDVKVVTGGIPYFAIIDELHVMAQSKHAKKVIAQIRGGMITNPSSLLIIITTQSDGPPTGVFKSELDYARGVRDGRITRGVRMLPVLYEFSEGVQTSDDQAWRDPKLWPMVLPNVGRSITIERLVQEYQTAQDKGADDLQIWASQHLNIEIGLGLHANRWIGADFWPACEHEGLTLEYLLASSDVAVVGADGGGRDDLFGLGVIGRHRKTRLWQLWARAWCLEIVPNERRKSLASTLEGFRDDGDLRIVQTEQQIVREAADVCERVREAGLLPEKNAIGLDQAKAAAFEDELEARGFTLGELVVGVPQNYQLQRGIYRLEGRLTDGVARHGGQRLLSWSVGNAKTELKGSNTYITKEAAGVAKIDPLMALFNASYLMTFNPVAAPVADIEAMFA